MVKKFSMNETELKRVRLRRTMLIVCAGLILGAILLLILPTRFPLPFRLGLAFVDLVAAATIWLLARQNLKPR